MEIKYLGHSAFEFRTQKGNILVDPFLILAGKYEPQDITDIFLTHGHGDHIGSAIELSKKFKATITAIFELANYCLSQGSISNGISFGGKIEFPWGWVVYTPAFHSSSTADGIYTGMPASIVFDIEGVRIYHAGDTCLNSEMDIVRDLYTPEIALLPIGGHYTMDIEQAAIATQKLGVNIVIPMHYNTFPAINANAEEFRTLVKNKTNAQAIILKPNETLKF